MDETDYIHLLLLCRWLRSSSAPAHLTTRSARAAPSTSKAIRITPINEGSLCPKGASTWQLTVNDQRPKKPLYRAPHATEWKEVEWEWAMEEIAKALPYGFGIAWNGISFQEQQAGSQTGALYTLSILIVFLCLAALYESWSIPIAVHLGCAAGVDRCARYDGCFRHEQRRVLPGGPARHHCLSRRTPF